MGEYRQLFDASVADPPCAFWAQPPARLRGLAHRGGFSTTVTRRSTDGFPTVS